MKLKLKLEYGCTIHNVSVDDVYLSDMSCENVKNLMKDVVNNLPMEDSQKCKDKLLSIIDTIVTEIVDKSYTLNYGTEYENIFVDIVDTKSFRVRCFYDTITQHNWMTVNDETQYDIDTVKLKKVIVELLDVYYTKQTNDDLTCVNTYEQILSDVILDFGDLKHVSPHCPCCGDNVYTYTLNLNY